ncbi:hypothetical protein YK48G_19900 [Lentilactobacillus fungorum]|uniref:Uncharacterized protein n=1 Tax=Lentilactobacillus fungorum TaxID=2201250 RepID=A0ABQ3W160_9LACO|nr:hypothetical protein YK48G_19900 [Lentilactobacillus fungorum]
MLFKTTTFVDRIAFALSLMAIPGFWYDFVFRFADTKQHLISVTELFLAVTALVGVLYAGTAVMVHLS